MYILARLRATTAAILMFLAAAMARPATPAVDLPTDYEVKAAFLYNFAKFVRWPDDAAGGPRFVVAIVGEDPFGAVIDRAFLGKTVLGRPMAFIGSSERAHLAEVLGAFKGESVLTVGEMDRFTDGGGMVGFRLKDSTVKFEVNLRELKQARLQMSSQIIRLAQRVIEDGG